ncbi:hypothetical protein FACS1894170_12660 [Planctomycetales bacterium]|nr:hypothetical protein FACS1894170_12660 [Planctomycetales bacterium]
MAQMCHKTQGGKYLGIAYTYYMAVSMMPPSLFYGPSQDKWCIEVDDEDCCN